jgi:2-acylglycerol O-acyltransferase 2
MFHPACEIQLFNRLWPIPVGIAIASAFRYPKQSVFAYILLFFLTYKRDAWHTGAQVSSWFGKGRLSDALARYLRASLHTPHLDKVKSHAARGGRMIFAIHPHSMFGISTLIHFCLNRLVTRSMLGPSIDFRVCTINLNFWIPLLREYLMARGFVCADKSTFRKLLDRGISPVIVPGGAEETLYAYPGSADLVVKKRTGFVREAIRNNAWLVPVYCFGDNEAVPVFRSKAILRVQRIIQKFLTFATPLLVPYFTRCQLNMVIGEPLEPPPLTEGSAEERTTLYHAKYLEALEQLFKQFVGTYGTDAEKAGKGLRFIK